MKTLSTKQIASIVDIDRVTLERWLKDRKIKMPKMVRIGSRRFRLWSWGDLKRIRQFKAENYRKGRGRKRRKGNK
jgi:hypothetical protein